VSESRENYTRKCFIISRKESQHQVVVGKDKKRKGSDRGKQEFNKKAKQNKNTLNRDTSALYLLRATQKTRDGSILIALENVET
jgi:hypothetical protein